MDFEVSKKAKRRNQRSRKKETLKNSLKKSQVEDVNKVESEHQPHQQSRMKKSLEITKDQILADCKTKKTTNMVKTAVSAAESASQSVVELARAPKPKSSVEAERLDVQQKESHSASPQIAEKTREQINAEREARKLEKQLIKKKITSSSSGGEKVIQAEVKNEKKPASTSVVAKMNSDTDLAFKMKKLRIVDGENKVKPATKAERRAKQEEQRAAKAKALEEKNAMISAKKPIEAQTKRLQEIKPSPPLAALHKTTVTQPLKTTALHKVKLFKHLYSDKSDLNINVNQKLHPAIIKLGLQYVNDSIVGSNARCYAFLNAMKILINDYRTPQEKEFSRGLEAEIQRAVEFLQNCRPLAVSMTNALKHIKVLISQENSTNDNDDDKKYRLMEKIDTYANEQIEMAAIAISLKVREKISNGDVILTYACSSLIKRTLIEAWKTLELKFKVIIVDSRPDHEGQEMLNSLTMLGINCTYVLINAVSFVMPEVTKVLLGAHALLANGYVMSRCGTAQIALVAKSFNVPVLVCCETHKFSERVQTDAFVFNEIGDPKALVKNKNSRDASDDLKDWESTAHLTPLNLRYDFTPPELVTAVVTEVAILPCTSVQVILRVKPAE